MSRCRNVVCIPLCSSFSPNSPGYMHLKDSENSSSSFVEQRSSMNRIEAWHLRTCLGSKKKKKRNRNRFSEKESRVKTHKDSNILLEYHVFDSKIAIFD